ncbi:TetR/AcrR family transcriptional regulator [Oricola sp.]|uniref:TetR/AcrR family transcriptional regulator n=1 Tax=Oricola sp. TaxID=1979950 RepID=UPI0025F7671D|nr:TetR/AcrR family transcriptional regulator [Oricola sp.]MCI5077452.1 TetR/AcrR family transcriptional regulator [Oricola sp.]
MAAALKSRISEDDDQNERGANRRDLMLETACELIYEKGYASASMRDIANAVGVTQAAMYYHFANKEEMLFALIKGFNDQLLAVITGAMSASGDPAEGLRGTIRAHILLGRSHYREFKLISEDKRHLSESHAEELRLNERTIFGLYRDRMAEIIAANGITGRDPAVCAFNTLSMINYVFNWYRQDGRMSLEDIADQTAAFAIGGLTGS